MITRTFVSILFVAGPRGDANSVGFPSKPIIEVACSVVYPVSNYPVFKIDPVAAIENAHVGEANRDLSVAQSLEGGAKVFLIQDQRIRWRNELSFSDGQ